MSKNKRQFVGLVFFGIWLAGLLLIPGFLQIITAILWAVICVLAGLFTLWLWGRLFS